MDLHTEKTAIKSPNDWRKTHMIAPRRFLPSVSSLLALEAVERLGTALKAAEELSLTHSAVSRQLKVLEEQIGVKMLIRDGKGLALTPAGANYAQSVRGYLHQLARASLLLKASGTRSSLNLAILPAFGMYWLTPHLKAFTAANPDVNVHQSTRLSEIDFGREGFDAAIHFGHMDWPGVDYLQLSTERVIPACAPDLARDLPFTPQALLTQPLLHLETRPGAWEQWFEHHGCEATQLRGMLFDQFANMSEAAAAGMGVALLPEFVAQKEIANRRLVPAFDDYMPSEGIYYLVWPKATQLNSALSRLIDWLERTAAATRISSPAN
jgi:DNA-binding transcriptional LysR family regulator